MDSSPGARPLHAGDGVEVGERLAAFAADLLHYLRRRPIVVAGPGGVDAGVVHDDPRAELCQV